MAFEVALPVGGISQLPLQVSDSNACDASITSGKDSPVSSSSSAPEPGASMPPLKLDSDVKKDPMPEHSASLKSPSVMESPVDVPKDFDQLPIEMLSLIDRFIESLNAKIYDTPPSIDRLSSLFQDFYVTANAAIAVHINALSSKQSRQTSFDPVERLSARAIAEEARAASKTLNPSKEQQMLTPQEIAERRRARRLLECRRLSLEEAVERRVCDCVYDRIWRHRSTLDEVRDEKLRSRTAALSLVGIGLNDLGIDLKSPTIGQVQQSEIENWITKARASLLRMGDARHPLGKLQCLADAHKNIVDLLTILHQGSSSADEILPTLIYTLITTPPEGINVISNLYFVQRFRAEDKVDGEAAYCLTNLEAAITFLETVDLATLRAEESCHGTNTSSNAQSRSEESAAEGTPSEQNTTSMLTIPVTEADLPQSHDVASPSREKSDDTVPARPRPSSHRRRISDLFQPPVAVIGAASDVMRNGADQGIKSIGQALDNSYKLLFGRLDEHGQAGSVREHVQPIVVPKTLDEARKLVAPKLAGSEDETLQSRAPGTSYSLLTSYDHRKVEDGILGAIVGRRQAPRDSSVDSRTSSKSSLTESAGLTGMAAVESMKNLGNSLNPLNRLGGMSVMRGFGRSSSATAMTPPSVPRSADSGRAQPRHQDFDDRGSPSNIETKSLPPVQRFLDVKNANELNLGEISELLSDYKRLAEALRVMGAF